MRTLSNILFESPQFKALSNEDKFRICNIGASPIKNLTQLPLLKYHNNVRCNMWMSEVQYPDVDFTPRYTHMIIRKPRHHVLSQYFHCTEGNVQGEKREVRLKTMKSLESWLSHWILAMGNSTKFRENRFKFQCYPPINLQSRYAGFIDHHPKPSHNQAHVHRVVSMKNMQQKFTVIGPLDEIDKVLCVTYIHYTGWIPDVCNCSNQNNTSSSRRRRLTDHGVTHHGSTYNTTQFEDTLIEKLVERDETLYDYAKRLFAVQLKVVEEHLNVTICDKIKDNKS